MSTKEEGNFFTKTNAKEIYVYVKRLLHWVPVLNYTWKLKIFITITHNQTRLLHLEANSHEVAVVKILIGILTQA
jgi:hypothetical protein